MTYEPPTPRPHTSRTAEAERLRRWRLVLGPAGSTAQRGTSQVAATPQEQLPDEDAALDRTLDALYGETASAGPGTRAGGLGASVPGVARWLGDIRTYFPTPAVQLLQRDAVHRLGLGALLAEPELLAAVEPDVHLVGALLGLREALPEASRRTAREVVRTVTADVERRLGQRLRSSAQGALDRSARARRPRHRDIDWPRTIRANLAHYLPEHRTVVPAHLVGHARAASGIQRELVLCVDQSASMAPSVVYASVFGSVLASLRSLATRLVVFDAEVADLTEHLQDPVDVLFGMQLGGGTDIGRALAYCEARLARPTETVLVLLSDLHEGRSRGELRARAARLVSQGVHLIALLALADEGAPAYDREQAAALAELGVPTFACTPDRFPEVLAAALEGRPLPQPAP